MSKNRKIKIFCREKNRQRIIYHKDHQKIFSKNIYNDHMINRMIQFRSLEDQRIIMILMIHDLWIFSDDLGRSL